ncbi:HAMP domain-containing sensor histidine kinase [Microlunatus ginsengisoli]|uniref:histidine kinase n=1 Tax=Microlunatus ginsengisoli TaxID=363863 RepID=A0ABP7AUM4_9ACTN
MRNHRLAAASVRTRVALGVIAGLAVVLALLCVAVNAIFVAQSERNLDALLAGRLQLGRQLARTGVGPQQIVNRVSTTSVSAQLVLANGSVFTAGPAGGEVRSASATLNTGPNGQGRVDGSRLTVSVDIGLVRGAQQRLGRVLVLGSLVALAVSAALVVLVVRIALRPLDDVAGLARSITSGQRGGRLRPERTDTEIGQTAQALDEMLDELEGAEARARQAEESSRRFLADAAHELRTPVAGIQAAAETLLHDGSTMEPAQREQLEVLLIREARRAGTLISDLLTTARLDAGLRLESTPTSLGGLAAAEAERARLLFPQASVTLHGDVKTGDIPPGDMQPGDVVVGCDPDRIGGVLRNLLDNALRAAGPAGRISIAVTADSSWAHVDVVDSGPGVPPAERERIFDRLVRLDGSRGDFAGGSGLGLAIARGYARAHGGDLVCLEPPPGWGALFRLSLPRNG